MTGVRVLLVSEMICMAGLSTISEHYIEYLLESRKYSKRKFGSYSHQETDANGLVLVG